jgi:hypothetical protein
MRISPSATSHRGEDRFQPFGLQQAFFQMAGFQMAGDKIVQLVHRHGRAQRLRSILIGFRSDPPAAAHGRPQRRGPEGGRLCPAEIDALAEKDVITSRDAAA